MKKTFLFMLILLSMAACKQNPNETTTSEVNVTPSDPNQATLTQEEMTQGWQLLFDGVSTKGWHTYNQSGVGSAWKITEGSFMLDTTQRDAEGRIVGGGDIVTDGEYENFELALEWKISPCGNSGIFFGILEQVEISNTYFSAPEMQVLDDACHPDAKIIKHRSGDLYDLISCSTVTVKPAMEWNKVRIHKLNNAVDFYLNDTKVVSFTMGTPEWDKMIAGSKFKEWPVFGKTAKGKIGLQDHGNAVWFRNIKIRML